MEKGKISAFQMAVMMNLTKMAKPILLVPAITATQKKKFMGLSHLAFLYRIFGRVHSLR
ncbi:MAG TPA: hypothetical protein VJ546_11160 [Bacillales bacterium]|nr:hypothetical protein [Bacillales bacterium]